MLSSIKHIVLVKAKKKTCFMMKSMNKFYTLVAKVTIAKINCDFYGKRQIMLQCKIVNWLTVSFHTIYSK